MTTRLLLPACLAGMLTVTSGCTGGRTASPAAARAPTAATPASPGRDAPVPAARPGAMTGGVQTASSSSPDGVSPQENAAWTTGPMAVCLYEAEQLSRLGNASQKALVTGLYRNIRAAQVYSPMAQKLSPGTVSTVTPLYEFAVNDACNSVEQALLSVLKKQVPVTGGSRD